MALLGEEVVEEWLNRLGYFTIRGIKLGVDEIDLLAFKPKAGGAHECGHIEVQFSTNPVSYISAVPEEIRKQRGIGAQNAKVRPEAELQRGITEWIWKKFDQPKKKDLLHRIWPGQWTRELAVNVVKHPEELELFEKAGISILRIKDVIRDLMTKKTTISSAAGGDLITLMKLGMNDGDV